MPEPFPASEAAIRSVSDACWLAILSIMYEDERPHHGDSDNICCTTQHRAAEISPHRATRCFGSRDSWKVIHDSIMYVYVLADSNRFRK